MRTRVTIQGLGHSPKLEIVKTGTRDELRIKPDPEAAIAVLFLYAMGGVLWGTMFLGSKAMEIVRLTPVVDMPVPLRGYLVGLVALCILAVAIGDGIRIDKQQGTVCVWRVSRFLPFSGTTFRIADVGRVVVARHLPGGFCTPRRLKELVDQAPSQRVAFAVSLQHRGRETCVCVCPTSSAALLLASRLSEFLDVGVKDGSTGVDVVREPGRVWETLQERYGREGLPSDLPTKPEHSRATVEHRDGEVRVVIPSPMGAEGLTCPSFFLNALSFVVLFGGLMYGLHRAVGGPGEALFLWLVVIVVGVVIAFGERGFLREMSRETIVTASPARLRVERRVWGRSRRDEIPGHSLRHLLVVGGTDRKTRATRWMSRRSQLANALWTAGVAARGKVIVAVGPGKRLRFADTLPGDEVEWIHGILQRALVDADWCAAGADGSGTV